MGNFITDFFTAAKEKRRQLLCEKASEKISAIGEVTLESTGKIEEAKLAVDKLDSMQFDALPEKNIYLEALKKYADLKAKEVSEMIEAIESIKKITIDSRKIIEAAKQAYDMLDADAKQKVNNYSVLSEAEKKAEEMLVAEGAIGRLISSYDEVKGITWYNANCKKTYSNYILPYIGKGDDGDVWLRMICRYIGNRWIFFDNMIIVVDDERYYRSFEHDKVVRDNRGEFVWEYFDVSPDDSDVAMLKAIAKSEKTLVRFQGDEKYRDFIVPEEYKQGIKDILIAYKYMK